MYIYILHHIPEFPVAQDLGFAGAPTPIEHGLCHAHPVDGSQFLVPAAWIRRASVKSGVMWLKQ